MAGSFDAVFCAHRDGAKRLPDAEWLPVACDLELHGSRDVADSPVWDVAFVGTDGGVPRKFYLQALRERYPQSLIGPAEHTQLATIYSQARVGFNYSIAEDVNMRIFEVLAAGSLLVTNAPCHQDLAALGLEDRQHLVLYHSPQELVDLIDHYLAHPEERRAIAAAGCALVKERHTYVHRLTQLLASVRERLGVGRAEETIACASS